MSEFIKFLFKRRVHVQSYRKGGPESWEVIELNTIQGFIHDWRKFGLSVAVYNIRVMWKHRKEATWTYTD